MFIPLWVSDCFSHSALFYLFFEQESMNMVLPAMQLAGKIPDVHVQLWASALLRGEFYQHDF